MKNGSFQRGVLLLAASSLLSPAAWADRGWHPAHRPGPPSVHVSPQIHSHHQHHYTHSGSSSRHFWGTVGVLAGVSALYVAMQPRTTYYESRTVYTPSVYYTPPPQVVTQTYAVPVEQVAGSVTLAQGTPLPPPPPSAQALPTVQEGPGSSGAQWWYACKRPAGYYPYVRECPSGWEKVAATPPGVSGY